MAIIPWPNFDFQRYNDWNPSRDDSAKIVQLILSVFSIALCTATLIAWLLLSCIDWKKFRFHYDFQLPRTSLFMVVLTSLFLVIINASIDLMYRDFLFCQFTEEGQSYQLPHVLFTISNVPYFRLITHSIGSLNYYIFLVSISWIVYSLINIIFIVFFPQLRESFRKRMFVFSFQCLVCFGFTLNPVVIVIAINPETPFVVIGLFSYFHTLNLWAFCILFVVPYSLAPALAISLTIIIVTKLRVTSLRSKEITGHTIKLTDLEKRLIIYVSILIIIVVFQGIDFILLILLSPEYFEAVTKFILCITVNSPILTLPSNFTGSNATLNDTVPVYRENPYGDVDDCRMFELEANSHFPNYITLSFPLLYRLTWIPIFFVLIPHITPKLLKKLFTRLKDKYSS